MSKYVKKHSLKAGLPPGSLVHVGTRKQDRIRITQICYSDERFDICLLNEGNNARRWIDVVGLHEVQVIEKIGACFEIHPLVLEDILNTEQRPKIENLGEYIYIVVKILSYDSQAAEFATEQVSLILGANFVLSFSETGNGPFNPVRERIRQGIGRIRKMGADFLVYTLLDLIVDNYFLVLEELGEKIEYVEDELVTKPSPDTLQVIHKMKRQMLFLHKSVWPLREIIGSLERGDTPLIDGSIEIYVRDLYDHIIQVMDTTETLRDILSSMLDIYLSSISNRMNEIMKVLTIISTVFIPLSFIVGLYGMNLKGMPEYDWPWMYPFVWILMFTIAGSMLVYFKKKKWW